MKPFAIVVASMGRCGSTLMWETLHQRFRNIDFVRDLTPDPCLAPGTVCKTHDFAPSTLSNSKVIYMFGDPVDTAISAHTPAVNIKAHYHHLHADYRRCVRFCEEDVMRLAENFRSWYCQHDFPVLTVRYETLYEHLDEVQDFIGASLCFPTWKERATKPLLHHKSDVLRRTYADLSSEIAAAADIKLWNAEE